MPRRGVLMAETGGSQPQSKTFATFHSGPFKLGELERRHWEHPAPPYNPHLHLSGVEMRMGRQGEGYEHLRIFQGELRYGNWDYCVIYKKERIVWVFPNPTDRAKQQEQEKHIRDELLSLGKLRLANDEPLMSIHLEVLSDHSWLEDGPDDANSIWLLGDEFPG